MSAPMVGKMRSQLRQRYWELVKQRDAIKSGSPRHERDANHDSLTMAQLHDYKARIKSHEAGLYEIEVEIGQIAKMLRDGDGKSRMGAQT